MKQYHNYQDYQVFRAQLPKGKTVGMVPTMGNLHEGHGALINQARAENDIVVLHLFVNPTQFSEKSDFESYPRTLEADLAFAKAHAVDVVITPSVADVYPDDDLLGIAIKDRSRQCEESLVRPGHFEGVMTVILKMFIAVMPNRAYFGEKDDVQLAWIKDMVKAFLLPIDIVPFPIQRYPSGLPLSSRLNRLTESQLALAHEVTEAIHCALRTGGDEIILRNILTDKGLKVDYLTLRSNQLAYAFFVEGVRLIDHLHLETGTC